MDSVLTHASDIAIFGNSYPNVACITLGLPTLCHSNGMREYRAAALASEPSTFLSNCYNEPIQPVLPLSEKLQDTTIIGSGPLDKLLMTPTLYNTLSEQQADSTHCDDCVIPAFRKGIEFMTRTKALETLTDAVSTTSPYTLVSELKTRGIMDPMEEPYNRPQFMSQHASASLRFVPFSVGDALHITSNVATEGPPLRAYVLVRRIWSVDTQILPAVFLDVELLATNYLTESIIPVFFTGNIITIPATDLRLGLVARRIPVVIVSSIPTSDAPITMHMPLQGDFKGEVPYGNCCDSDDVVCHIQGSIESQDVTSFALTIASVLRQDFVAVNEVDFASLIMWHLPAKKDVLQESRGKHGLYGEQASLYDISIQDIVIDEGLLHEEADLFEIGPQTEPAPKSSPCDAYSYIIQPADEDSVSSNQGYQIYGVPVLANTTLRYMNVNEAKEIPCSNCEQILPASSLCITSCQHAFLNEETPELSLIHRTAAALLLNRHSSAYQCPLCLSLYCSNCRNKMLGSITDNYLARVHTVINSTHPDAVGFYNINTPCNRCLRGYVENSYIVSARQDSPLVRYYLRRLRKFSDSRYKDKSPSFMDVGRLMVDYRSYFSSLVKAENVDEAALQNATSRFVLELKTLRQSWPFARHLINWTSSATTPSILGMLSITRLNYIRLSGQCFLILDATINEFSAKPIVSIPTSPSAIIGANSTQYMLDLVENTWDLYRTTTNIYFKGAPFYTEEYVSQYFNRPLDAWDPPSVIEKREKKRPERKPKVVEPLDSTKPKPEPTLANSQASNGGVGGSLSGPEQLDNGESRKRTRRKAAEVCAAREAKDAVMSQQSETETVRRGRPLQVSNAAARRDNPLASSDSGTVILPDTYVCNYLTPSIMNEAMTSWIGRAIRPFIPQRGMATVRMDGSTMVTAAQQVFDLSGEKEKTENGNSAISAFSARIPFSLPTSIQIDRLRTEMSEGCLFYTGFDRSLRKLIEEYGETGDEELQKLVQEMNASDLPVTRNAEVLGRFQKLLMNSGEDTVPDAVTVMNYIRTNVLPGFLETRYRLETHFDYGHNTENIRTLQTLNRILRLQDVCSCEHSALMAEIEEERRQRQRDAEEDAKELISLATKEQTDTMAGQQAIQRASTLQEAKSAYGLTRPQVQLPVAQERQPGRQVIAAEKKMKRMQDLTQRIGCIDQLLAAVRERDNSPAIVQVLDFGIFPASPTLQQIVAEKRETELRKYLESLGSIEARTRKSMEELLTSIDATRRGLIELRRKQAQLVDELIDFMKEKYRLDDAIGEVATTISAIALSMATMRVPPVDHALPSDVHHLVSMRERLAKELADLLEDGGK